MLPNGNGALCWFCGNSTALPCSAIVSKARQRAWPRKQESGQSAGPKRAYQAAAPLQKRVQQPKKPAVGLPWWPWTCLPAAAVVRRCARTGRAARCPTLQRCAHEAARTEAHRCAGWVQSCADFCAGCWQLPAHCCLSSSASSVPQAASFWPAQIACLLYLLQARVRAIADIVSALVAGVRRGEDVDLNSIKREVGAGQGLKVVGWLVGCAPDVFHYLQVWHAHFDLVMSHLLSFASGSRARLPPNAPLASFPAVPRGCLRASLLPFSAVYQGHRPSAHAGAHSASSAGPTGRRAADVFRAVQPRSRTLLCLPVPPYLFSVCTAGTGAVLHGQSAQAGGDHCGAA